MKTSGISGVSENIKKRGMRNRKKVKQVRHRGVEEHREKRSNAEPRIEEKEAEETGCGKLRRAEKDKSRTLGK